MDGIYDPGARHGWYDKLGFLEESVCFHSRFDMTMECGPCTALTILATEVIKVLPYDQTRLVFTKEQPLVTF